MARSVLLVLVLVGVAAALPWDDFGEYGRASRGGTTCDCGWVNRGRIVGGKETRANEYPLMASVQLNGRHNCGGSIITPWHVLTAAHCTFDYNGRPYNPSQLSINVGAHRQGARSEGVYRVDKYINHERYNKDTLIFDISIFLVKNQIKFSQNVGPTCLPNKPLNLVGQKIKAIGWGDTYNQAGKGSNVLLEVDLRVISFKDCEAGWKSHPVSHPRADNNVCTFEVNKDTCQGDSGGPLIWLDPSVNRYVQAALVSYGGICGGSQPAPNTDVSLFIPWINKVVQSTKPGVQTCSKV